MLKKIEKRQAKIIADYLLNKIDNDPYFDFKLEVVDKTLEGCIEYVKSQAKKQAENGFAWVNDDEVFTWVYDYYMEDKLNCEPSKVKKQNFNKENKKEIVKNCIYEQLSLFD